MAERLRPQQGIYYASGVRPPGFYSLLLLEKNGNPPPGAVPDLVARLWKLYEGLTSGLIPDLWPVTVPSGNLQVLIGYGSPVVDVYDDDGSKRVRVPDWFQFRAPKPTKRDGGPILTDADVELGSRVDGTADKGESAGTEPVSSAIHYDVDTAGIDPTRIAVAVQFTAETPLAVERAVVETWKLLYDERSGGTEPALAIRAAFAGSQRDDGRSWIDFHDGLSNLASDEREGVIFIGAPCGDSVAVPDEGWPDGGTYMAFMRLAINLERWREIARGWDAVAANPRYASYPSGQEQLVGRMLLSGCPIIEDPTAITEEGRQIGQVDPACPGRNARYAFPDPPRTVVSNSGKPRVLGGSHIARVHHPPNPETAPPCDPVSRRIFRQGYEFFEATTRARTFRVGLNFVSFQRRPGAVAHILTTDGWLGTTRRSRSYQLAGGFGGPYSKPGAKRAAVTKPLISAYAAGLFFVPPSSTAERFPGERLLK
jgi:deferrochelatase/peroxidase EfeB